MLEEEYEQKHEEELRTTGSGSANTSTELVLFAHSKHNGGNEMCFFPPFYSRSFDHYSHSLDHPA